MYVLLLVRNQSLFSSFPGAPCSVSVIKFRYKILPFQMHVSFIPCFWSARMLPHSASGSHWTWLCDQYNSRASPTNEKAPRTGEFLCAVLSAYTSTEHCSSIAADWLTVYPWKQECASLFCFLWCNYRQVIDINTEICVNLLSLRSVTFLLLRFRSYL